MNNDIDLSYTASINGNRYSMKHISEEKIEDLITDFELRNDKTNYKVLIDEHGTGLSPPSEYELKSLIGKMWINNIISEPQENDLGGTYDLSTQDYFPVVGNQGGQGSCAAWALTYYAYGYLEAKDYGWDASSGNNSYLMSPAWTFNKVSTSNYGSWMTTNAQIVVDWGCATMKTMSYDDMDYYSWGDELAWRDAPFHRALDYYLMDFDEVNPNSTIDTIKSFISSGTPVTFAFDAYEYNDGFNDGNYVLSSLEYDSPTYNHAQCIVGFNDTKSDDGDIGAFKVVNSWGTSFGDNGYYWLTYECLKEIGYAIGDFCLHLCVLTDRLDYQPDLIATWEFSSAPTRMQEIISLGIGPYDTPLKYKTPWYIYDNTFSFPNFMAVDISEFKSEYDAENNILFYLDIGPSSSTGSISSFLIERYINGVLDAITEESRDVPQTNPGYVYNTFANLDHNLKVILETPIKPKLNNVYRVNATVINKGIHNETNLDLYLNLDGILINYKHITSLYIGSNETIQYLWIPKNYGKYNFSAYVPPIPEEEFVYDNSKYEVISIHEILLFNGMYINHTYSQGDYEYDSEVSYNQVSNSSYNVNWELSLNESHYPGYWELDASTRIMENCSGMIYFGNDLHTPFWIFKEIQLGDIIPIALSTAIDDKFKVKDDLVYNLQGFGLVEVWVLEQVENSGSKAWYEKSTGILLNGTFIYGIGSNYSFDFINTNAEFSNIFLPGQFNVSSTAGTPDRDGCFTLNWNSSDGALKYTIYQHDKLITNINENLTLLIEDVKNFALTCTGYTNGTYYFVIVAQNDYGKTLSNCLRVNVFLISNTTIPSYYPTILVSLIGLISFFVYLKRKKFFK